MSDLHISDQRLADMMEDLEKVSAQIVGSHLSPDECDLYASDLLMQQERARLDAHLDSCDDCAMKVGRLLDESPSIPFSAGSVSKLIRRVKEGDEEAAQQLLVRYAPRVTGLARRRLQGKNLRVADEDDVAQSVFAGFFLGAERGQYNQLQDRDDLWHLLFKITIRKAQRLVTEQQRQKRRQDPPSPGPADVQRSDPTVEQVADPNPLPDLEVLANETIERLLNRLDEKGRLRSIAIWKWEGYSNEEIATMLGCSSRAITRKLGLIRTIWTEEEAS